MNIKIKCRIFQYWIKENNLLQYIYIEKRGRIQIIVESGYLNGRLGEFFFFYLIKNYGYF